MSAYSQLPFSTRAADRLAPPGAEPAHHASTHVDEQHTARKGAPPCKVTYEANIDICALALLPVVSEKHDKSLSCCLLDQRCAGRHAVARQWHKVLKYLRHRGQCEHVCERQLGLGVIMLLCSFRQPPAWHGQSFGQLDDANFPVMLDGHSKLPT